MGQPCLTNNGPFTFVSSKNIRDYAILNASGSTPPVTDISIDRDEENSTCLQGNPIGVNQTCTLLLNTNKSAPSGNYTLTVHDTEILNDPILQFSISNKDDPISTSVELNNSALSVKKINVENTGSEATTVYYAINNGQYLESYQTGDPSDWCNPTLCTNPCSNSSTTPTTLDSNSKCYIYLKSVDNTPELNIGQTKNATIDIYKRQIPTPVDTFTANTTKVLYAVGDFTTLKNSNAETETANNIAKFDGVTWNTIPAGGFNDKINAIINDPLGNLYVAGDFTSNTTNNQTFNHIAYWSGDSTWHDLKVYMNTPSNSVNALLISNGNLYVGGNFNKLGAQSTSDKIDTHNIAKYNPLSGIWSGVGSGFNDAVTHLTSDANNIYAAGNFTEDGNNNDEFTHIAAWDNTNWNALNSKDLLSNKKVTTLVRSPNDEIYMAYSNASSSQANIVKWTDNTWMPIALEPNKNYNTNDAINSMIFSSTGTLEYIGGDFSQSADGTSIRKFAKWNPEDSTWSGLYTYLNNANERINSSLLSLSPTNNEIWIAGKFNAININDSLQTYSIAKRDVNATGTNDWTNISTDANAYHIDTSDDDTHQIKQILPNVELSLIKNNIE